MIENLLNPNIQYTDPDALQFCLPLSDTKFWYCQVNDCYERLTPDAETPESLIYDILCGYPEKLLSIASKVIEVKEFITNHRYWHTGEIDVTELDHEEQLELLKGYGYSWDDFTSEAERNQIICECHFEENIREYEND